MQAVISGMKCDTTKYYIQIKDGMKRYTFRCFYLTAFSFGEGKLLVVST